MIRIGNSKYYFQQYIILYSSRLKNHSGIMTVSLYIVYSVMKFGRTSINY